MIFEDVKCFSSPRTSQMPGIGLAPVLERLGHLLLEDRPDPVVEVVDRLGVQVHRVEQGAPDVVLLLGVGGVADPHRAGVGVPGRWSSSTSVSSRSPPMPYMICRLSSFSAMSAMKAKKSTASQSKPSEYIPHRAKVASRIQVKR